MARPFQAHKQTQKMFLKKCSPKNPLPFARDFNRIDRDFNRIDRDRVIVIGLGLATVRSAVTSSGTAAISFAC